MTFTDIFSLKGHYLTYRDFWALTLGGYAGAVILTSSVVSAICSKYGGAKSATKYLDLSRKFKWITGAITFLYIFMMFVLALVNGLFVFGGQSMWIYLGVMLALQIVFTLIGVFVALPYLSTFIVSASNWCIAGSVFFLIQLPAMFDYMSASLVWLPAIFSGVPLAVKAGVSYLKVTQSDASVSYREKLHRSVRKYSFYATMLAALTCGIVITFFLAGTCITVYGPNVDGAWVPFAGTLRWNSRMMRSFAPHPCPGPGPCHVYLTAGADLTSEVFVNVHMPVDSAKYLTVNVNNGAIVLNATEFPTPLLDSHDQRLVFAVYVSGLAAGSDHSFTLSTEAGAVGEEKYEFRTAPSDAVKFVVAGDAGVTDFTAQIMTQMIAQSPHVAVIGGDVAYDNGFLSCACTWDAFLALWEARRVEDRFLVPLAFAAGNHDLAVNDNNLGAFDLQETGCNPEYITRTKPLFYGWFPFETSTTSLGVVEPRAVCARSTLHRHAVSGVANIWILDSAYVASPEENVKYVDANMAAGTNVAVYHVPLYSSNPSDWDKGVYLQDAWVAPLFDKHAFAACFENHAHTYKRTKPLLGGEIVATGGTVYLGDGKMGISGMAVPGLADVTTPAQNEIFEKTGAEFHFFAVTVDSAGMAIKVIDNSGVLFDQYSN